MKQTQQDTKNSVIDALRISTRLFEITIENVQFREKFESWKQLYACKLGNFKKIARNLNMPN